MTLVRPSAVVTLDGQRLTSAEGAVMRVRARLGLGPAHDCVDIFCWPSSKLKDAAVGGQLSVALGSVGDEKNIWTGEVTGVRLTPDCVALEGLAATIALSRTYTSQSFVGVSIADMVQQVASAAGITIDGASGDTSLSSYTIDDRRSVWAHINDLARMIGADVTATGAGALKFVAPTSSPGGAIASAGASVLSTVTSQLAALAGGGGAAGLRHGANVIDWRARTFRPADTLGVTSYGSASESGSDKWHWIKHDPSAAGSGPVQVAYGAQTKDAATAFSDAIATRSKRSARRTQVVVVGDATLRPGQTTQISGLPGDAGGDLRILAVEHLLDGDSGWVTRVTLELAA
jgi:hypothetical protein